MKNLSTIEKLLLITCIVLFFQVFRNVSLVFYIAILFLMYGLLYISFMLSSQSSLKKMEFSICEIAFLFSYINIPLISLFYLSIADYMVALPRFLVTMPFIIFTFLYKDYTETFIRYLLKTFCYFMALSALTIPLQSLTGAISFFAASSTREGLERFASLAGSSTALGTLGGVALAVIIFSEDKIFKKKEKIILMVSIVVGMIMSMQKAALINILICIIGYIFLANHINITKRIIIVIIIIISVASLISINPVTSEYFEKNFSYTFENDSSVGTKDDFLSRQTVLPILVVKKNGMIFRDFIFGIGFRALSGTMGLPSYPMAHNNYFSLLFSGGIIHLISFLFLISQILIHILTNLKNSNALGKVYLFIAILFMINMFIGAAEFYQPIMTVIIFVCINSFSKFKNQFFEKI